MMSGCLAAWQPCLLPLSLLLPSLVCLVCTAAARLLTAAMRREVWTSQRVAQSQALALAVA